MVLADGREVVVKVHQPDRSAAFLAQVQEVHDHHAFCEIFTHKRRRRIDVGATMTSMT